MLLSKQKKKRKKKRPTNFNNYLEVIIETMTSHTVFNNNNGKFKSDDAVIKNE